MIGNYQTINGFSELKIFFFMNSSFRICIAMTQRSLFDFCVSKKHKADKDLSVETAETPQTPAAKMSKPDSVPGSGSKVTRTFNPVWITQYDWLEYDSSTKRMFCKTCRAANIQSVFTKGGAGRCCLYFAYFFSEFQIEQNRTEFYCVEIC